ncbi:hypothetical protein [Saccharomonospora piscinae]|uniref:hypothetical protein n=1 Tax=Saccharomonospora piscinae TaxID=687388 RepID=UPI001ABE9E85|nr:hypothetical protein [Saccharomonospora piscinae]
MSVERLAVAVDRVLALRPLPALREADGYLAEATEMLGAIAAGSAARELAEAVAGLLAAREAVAEIHLLCDATDEALGRYLAALGAASPGPPTAAGPQPSPSPTPQPTASPDATLVAEVRRRGHKITPERIVRIARLPDDRIVWLEEGNEGSGLAHIESEHSLHFERHGVAKHDIVDLVFAALLRGRYCGLSGTDRPVYEVSYRGRTTRIAVTVGRNGYIVGANPVKLNRKLKG